MRKNIAYHQPKTLFSDTRRTEDPERPLQIYLSKTNTALLLAALHKNPNLQHLLHEALTEWHKNNLTWRPRRKCKP